MVRYFQSMSESLNISHKSAALAFASTTVIDNYFRASTFGTKQTIHNRSYYLNIALVMSLILGRVKIRNIVELGR